jgi:hypothetical protein
VIELACDCTALGKSSEAPLEDAHSDVIFVDGTSPRLRGPWSWRPTRTPWLPMPLVIAEEDEATQSPEMRVGS